MTDLTTMQVLNHFLSIESMKHGRNPVFQWTVFEDAKRVKRWIVKTVPVVEIYTSGLNPKMKGELNSIGGNMFEFSARFACNHREYDDHASDKSPEATRLIAVRHSKEGRTGTFELLDGAHRLVSMIRRGVTEVECMVAEIE